jgi:predicted membrane protein
MESNRNAGRGIIGIVLILIGLAFVGRTLDFFPRNIMHYIFSWQMILIVLGVIFVSTRDNKSTGYILLAIGLVFLIPEIWCIPSAYRKLFWPALLICVGVLIIFRSTNIIKFSDNSGNADGADYIDDISILGGGDKIITSNNFKGGRITSIFGGSKIDMINAQVAPGKNVIDMFCLFGGSTLIVPANWNIKLDVISIFGGFSDKRRIKSDTAKDVGKEIIIKGFVMFGGGELKN